MKMYKEKKENKKSWSLELIETRENSINLYAVDSITGEKIVNLISFLPNGTILLVESVDMWLKKEEYDPYEHGNMYTSKGSLIIANVSS